jgi:cytochrome c oxidase subunit 3
MHGYHLVSLSPWPILISLSLFSTAIGFLSFIYLYNNFTIIISIITLISIFTLWLRDIVREGTYLGDHTSKVATGLSIAFVWFMISEVMIFFSLFWAYFHSSLSPTIEIGLYWPPLYIEAVDIYNIPLLNTLLLLASGASVTWSHHAFLAGDRKNTIIGLIITIILAILFLIIQINEYYYSTFTLTDSVFGSSFYLLTGFHGCHVLIGAIFLIVSLYRVFSYNYTNLHNIGLEAGIYYYHLVDVVWLALFILIY